MKHSHVAAQLALSIGLRDGATFENIVPGRNLEVVEYLRHALSAPAVEQAVYLWGTSGVGKTHLLQAACHQLADTGKASAYLPMTLPDEITPALLEGLDALPLVCVDDVQFIAGQRDWEHALFHLYNRMRDAGGLLIVAGNAVPASLGLELADLSSRLAWGWVFQLKEPDDDEKCQILQLRAQRRGLELPIEVARYMLKNYRRDLDALLTLLDQLDYASLVEQRRLTIPFVRDRVRVKSKES